MKNKIKNVLSLVLLTVFLNNTVNASEEDYGEDIYKESILYQNNSFADDLSDEVDSFTYNSSIYSAITPHRATMRIDDEIPTNTIFWDPLYYSTNK